VRPIFRWFAALVFVVTAALAVLAGWDVVETRAFRKLLADVRAKGEPLTLQSLRKRPSSPDGLKSDRYVRAAAILATDGLEERRLFDRIREAGRAGEWPDGLADTARQHLRDHNEALQLLDRAVLLTFEGLSPGADNTSGYLFQLARLAGIRTSLQVHEHDDAHAAGSLCVELRLHQVLDWIGLIFPAPMGEIEDVGLSLSATHASAASLSCVATALADLDRDDALKRWFIGHRVVFLDQFFGRSNRPMIVEAGFGFQDIGLADTFGRVWFERRAKGRLETLSGIIAALDEPWPLRAGAVAALHDASRTSDAFRQSDVGVSNRIVDDLSRIRAARVVVAIERYRRDHHEALPARLDDLVPEYLQAVPVDPYAGWPIRFRVEARSYAVYGLGANGRDDGGDFDLLRFVLAVRQTRDIGLRIQLH